MSQSSLVSYRDYSAKHWNDRKGSGIKRIVIHHCASVLTVEQLGRIFQGKQASSTYGIGNDGRVGQYVPEEYRPWTTSGWEPDRNCITIEVSNSAVGGNWPCSDAAMTKLVELCADICKRNGIAKLYYDGKNGTLLRHCDYHATACPGPYIKSKTQWICDQVNARLSGSYAQKPAASGTLYRVQIGAFSSKANADKLLAQVKAKGFEAIEVKVGNLYKVQVGAYSKQANANAQLAKVKAAGFKDAFITITGGSTVASGLAPKPTIKVGSNVRLSNGAKTYTGGSLAAFMYSRVHKVTQISGDRAVISYGGQIVAAVHLSDLTLA